MWSSSAAGSLGCRGRPRCFLLHGCCVTSLCAEFLNPLRRTTSFLPWLLGCVQAPVDGGCESDRDHVSDGGAHFHEGPVGIRGRCHVTGLSVEMLTVHLDSRAALQVINGVIDSCSYRSHAPRSIIGRSWNSFQLRRVIGEGSRGLICASSAGIRNAGNVHC